MPTFPQKQEPTFNFTSPWPRGEAVDFELGAFDDFISSKGVSLVHYRAMKCPIGLSDPYDQRQTHEDHQGCSNGFVYTRVGTATALFTGNNSSTNQQDMGLVDFSTAQVTLARFYDELDCGNMVPVLVTPFDRFFLAEERIVVPNWQTFAVSLQETERLAFPLVIVEECMDADGNRYKQGEDFVVTPQGLLQWTGQRRPGRDAVLQRGKVVSIRYLYRPYFYVVRLGHEVRIAQVDDPAGGRTVLRMPEQCTVQREFVFESKKNDPQSKITNDLRQQMAPGDGTFGPR